MRKVWNKANPKEIGNTFTPMRKYVLNYASFELFEAYENAFFA
jgi:hypothetical protein